MARELPPKSQIQYTPYSMSMHYVCFISEIYEETSASYRKPYKWPQQTKSYRLQYLNWFYYGYWKNKSLVPVSMETRATLIAVTKLGPWTCQES